MADADSSKRKAEIELTGATSDKKSKVDADFAPPGEHHARGNDEDFNDEDMKEIDVANIIPGGRSSRSTRAKMSNISFDPLRAQLSNGIYVDYAKLAGGDEEEDEDDEEATLPPEPAEGDGENIEGEDEEENVEGEEEEEEDEDEDSAPATGNIAEEAA